jgi:formate hydrogenlyase subunit 3/multisubunit Na+/H+ antiporter MnhD subunit
MTAASLLLATSVLLPLGMAAACLLPSFRRRVPFLLALAPLPALLVAAVAPAGTMVFFPAPFRMMLEVDRPGAMLLVGAALLWSAAGAYASSYLGSKPGAARFSIWWLLTLAGCLGIFVVADIASFYLLFTLLSLAAYGLIAHEETAGARRAGGVYVVLALLGEAFLLLAFVMLATGSPEPNPLIRDVVAGLPLSPMRDGIVTLLILGFAIKMGLVPVHVWLPLAHPAAPMPASAVLSGVVVKAGVIGLMRFLPFEAGLPGWGDFLIVAGLVTAFYGAAVGFTQVRSKTVLAYSTVSQMGLLAVLIGTALGAADSGGLDLVAYYGVHHTLVKGALFLSVGIVAVSGGPRRWPVLLLTGVLALSLGGMPLTSGALAKLAAKPMLGSGVVGLATSLAAAGSTLLMLHFLRVLWRDAAPATASRAPMGEILPWLLVALASLVVPWTLYPSVANESLGDLLSIDALWKLAWPMALGAIGILGLSRIKSLPGAIPEGDILVLGRRALPFGRNWAMWLSEIDGSLRLWPVASLLLIGFAILLGGALIWRT